MIESLEKKSNSRKRSSPIWLSILWDLRQHPVLSVKKLRQISQLKSQISLVLWKIRFLHFNNSKRALLAWRRWEMPWRSLLQMTCSKKWSNRMSKSMRKSMNLNRKSRQESWPQLLEVVSRNSLHKSSSLSQRAKVAKSLRLSKEKQPMLKRKILLMLCTESKTQQFWKSNPKNGKEAHQKVNKRKLARNKPLPWQHQSSQCLLHNQCLTVHHTINCSQRHRPPQHLTTLKPNLNQL